MKNVIFILTIFAVLLLLIMCFTQVDSAQIQGSVDVKTAFPQLTFSQPVGVYNAGDNSNRLFIVEQAGRIQVFQNSRDATSSTVFLDITDRVLFGGEQGLLGLAFSPNFTRDGYFYVDYVAANPTRTIIERFNVDSVNLNLAKKNSAFIILEITQPFSNHKGGEIAFGPDGYLYIGVGDGGSEGDPLGNGQNRSTLLGKILRIDVSAPSTARNYGIPTNNPFVGNSAGYREEIYAYGFRNPWRFSFDSATGNLWVGDVGQDREEEIDVVQKGGNYGWNIMEGTLPYAGGNETGLISPVYEYDHTLGDAIIGGYVYHGAAMPALQSEYVYADYGSGKIWALSVNGTTATANALLIDSNLTISSFGIDQFGELFFCAFDGKIYQLTETTVPEMPLATSAAIVVVLISTVVYAFKKRTASSPSSFAPNSLLSSARAQTP